MVKVDAAYSFNSFGQLVFAGCESMPEPPVPKRRGRKKNEEKIKKNKELMQYVDFRVYFEQA